MVRRGVREVLNELRWHPEREAARGRIYYRDREDRKGYTIVRADEVEIIGPSSFTVGGATIPFYKVFRITYGGEPLFEREEAQTSS